MRSEAELDALHQSVVARFPKGLTPAQFRQVTLESADEDGRVYPHSIRDYFTRFSLLVGMWMAGLIDSRGGYNDPMEWFITDKGRAIVKESAAA